MPHPVEGHQHGSYAPDSLACNRSYTGAPPQTSEAALSDDPRPDPRLSGLDLEQQVCFNLSIAARGVVAAYRPLLEPLGLTHPQYLVMVSLWQHGPQTVKQLGTLLVLDSGTVSPLLKRLEATGHVRRTRSRTDERQVVVELTEQGTRLRARAVQVHAEVVRRLGVSQDELEQLRQVLEHLIAATRHTTGLSSAGDELETAST